MSFARNSVTGAITGGASGIGILIAICADQIVFPIAYYGSAAPAWTIAIFFLSGFVPAAVVGSVFGLVAITPYVYFRRCFVLGFGADLVALIALSAAWSFLQDAAGPLRPWYVNFGLIVLGASAGLLPLRRLATIAPAAATPRLIPEPQQ